MGCTNYVCTGLQLQLIKASICELKNRMENYLIAAIHSLLHVMKVSHITDSIFLFVNKQTNINL